MEYVQIGLIEPRLVELGSDGQASAVLGSGIDANDIRYHYRSEAAKAVGPYNQARGTYR